MIEPHAASPQINSTATRASEEDMVRHLEETGQFRILRRLDPRPVLPECSLPPTDGKRIGIVLDTETTGLTAASDEIIELAMVKFTFDEARIHDLVAIFEGLQQPSRPLSTEISRLTGLTDAMLAGAVMNDDAVAAFVISADLVIAHNAKFDRPFCERRFPPFREKAWACSATEVDWARLGVEGTKLGYILNSHGFFHSGHRALADCQALVEILAASPQNKSKSAFAQLVASSKKTTFEISAEGAPFQAKDILKARGYKWNSGGDGRLKSWVAIVSEAQVADEIAFLRREIFSRPVDLPVRRLTALDRYR